MMDILKWHRHWTVQLAGALTTGRALLALVGACGDGVWRGAGGSGSHLQCEQHRGQ